MTIYTAVSAGVVGLTLTPVGVAPAVAVAVCPTAEGPAAAADVPASLGALPADGPVARTFLRPRPRLAPAVGSAPAAAAAACPTAEGPAAAADVPALLGALPADGPLARALLRPRPAGLAPAAGSAPAAVVAVCPMPMPADGPLALVRAKLMSLQKLWSRNDHARASVLCDGVSLDSSSGARAAISSFLLSKISS